MVDKLPDEEDRFLCELAEHSPESTVRSYKNAIGRVVGYKELDGYSEITPTHVAEYIISESSKYEESTLYGVINSVTNYIAYAQQLNPELVKIQVLRKIQSHATAPSVNVDRWFAKECGFDKDSKNGDTIRSKEQAIEGYRRYLRRCEHGSRTHAVVELILATGCRITAISQIDRSDMDLQKGTITLRTSGKHVISSHPYVMSLPEICVDAIETYCEHERTSSLNDGATALFTARGSRVSIDTIRRSIKQTSQAAFDYETVKSGSEKIQSDHRSLTPYDLRQYGRRYLDE